MNLLNVAFVDNVAGNLGGDHVRTCSSCTHYVVDTTFTPFTGVDDTAVSLLGPEASCEQFPCTLVETCSYVNYSLSCFVVECPNFSSGSVGTTGTGSQSGCIVEAGYMYCFACIVEAGYSGVVIATSTPPYYYSTIAAVDCPLFSSGSVPGAAGTGGQSGCTNDAGISGTVVATTLPPYYESTLVSADCPIGSTGIVHGASGTSNMSGCTTNPGFSGVVTATSTAPFFNSTLVACEPGYYTTGDGGPCMGCNDGYMTDTLGADGASTCEPCPGGFYSPISTVACIECPPGSIVNSAGVGATTCEACAPGKYANTSDDTCGGFATNCEDCNVGEYSPAGAPACTNCASQGLEDLDQDPTTECEPSSCTQICDANFEDADCDATSSCTACEAGQFTVGGASTHSLHPCAVCAPGAYEVDGQCTLCPTGRYKSVLGSVSCLLCPAGKSSSTTGGTNIAVCQACNTGQYASAGADTCTLCESGRADTDQNASTPCADCAVGSFAGCGEVECAACVEGTADADLNPATPCTTILGDFVCPAGTFCAVMDCGGQNSTANDCLQCAAGHVGTDGLSCALCTQPNMISNDEHTACVPCSASTTPVIDRSRCVCDISQKQYNATGMHVHCFDNDYSVKSVQIVNSLSESCQTCPSCLDCSNGSIALKTGYQALLDTANKTHRHYVALRCPIESSCLSQPLIAPLALSELQLGQVVARPTQSCQVGARGRLCADCEPGYGHGAAGPCIECVAGSAMWWLWAIGIVAIIGLVYAILQRVMTKKRKKRQKRQEDAGVLFRYLASKDSDSTEGSISRSTLVVEFVEQGMSKAIAQEVVETIDIDHSGDVDENEFVAWMQQSRSKAETLKDVAKIVIGLVQVLKEAPEQLQEEGVFPEEWRMLEIFAFDLKMVVP